jgi:hypothetical protein
VVGNRFQSEVYGRYHGEERRRGRASLQRVKIGR